LQYKCVWVMCLSLRQPTPDPSFLVPAAQ
jgi:hypothetical protein